MNTENKSTPVIDNKNDILSILFIMDSSGSMIAMGDEPLQGLNDFYKQLNILLKETFDEPLPHITLYTTSTREDKRLRGIGIYSQKQLEKLDPQQI